MERKAEHTVTIEHRVLDVNKSGVADIEKEETIEQHQIRQLRTWVHESLKREDCTPAHRLLVVLTSAVWWQAYERGHDEAGSMQEPQIKSWTDATWKDGYLAGWQDRKSESETEEV